MEDLTDEQMEKVKRMYRAEQSFMILPAAVKWPFLINVVDSRFKSQCGRI